jgi:hypothetical protein
MYNARGSTSTGLYSVAYPAPGGSYPLPGTASSTVPQTMALSGQSPVQCASQAMAPPVNPNHLTAPNIIVIGAGVAGYKVARDLINQGYSVTLIEGRGRTGGRLWSDRSFGYPGLANDLGASWIHGPQPVRCESVNQADWVSGRCSGFTGEFAGLNGSTWNYGKVLIYY